ncbi:unnamed protein product [Polarella glacialis]|uniref:Branched-chain-amino-acid aminotransferase n=1 Tax=Polarella glacialis TaxID=89957 RepID=A0A813H000_POLGL|nr:unnamed protein product [Polarella glacialis]
MVVAKCQKDGEWADFQVQPYGPMEMEPAATVLNYGQALFEGMKAHRTSKGRIVLFRPEMNARRMARGAERFLMPPIPEKLFLEMCGAAVRANADWVPPEGKGELYLRPLLIGSGGALGVGASPEYTFVIYAAPVGRYFSGAGARLLVEGSHNRAAPLGTGDVKAAGNYAPCFAPQKAAKDAGYSDILYLDASGEHIEEAAASNFFCVDKDGVLRTPDLGTILPGVTRDSTLHLARLMAAAGEAGLKGVKEGSVSVEDVLASSEAFVTGTGAGVTPVAHVAVSRKGFGLQDILRASHQDTKLSADFLTPGPVVSGLQEALRAVQRELRPDTDGWLWDAFSS